MADVAYERLVAVFDAETRVAERNVDALFSRIGRLERELANFKGVDKYAQKFTDGQKKVDKSYRDTERKTEEHVGRLNRLLTRISSPVDKLTKVLNGNASGLGSGGFLPGLAQISEIVQGIPQVGRLIGGALSPLTSAVEEGMQFNAFLETTKIGLEGVAGSAEAADAFLAKVKDFSVKTPFEIDGILNGAQYMKTFGFHLDEVIPKLTIWGNGVAATGKISQDVLEGVIRAFGQMRAKGSVSAEEMEQLAERGIPSWELLAKAIGKTVAETRKLSQQGKLRGGAAVEAITAMMEIDPRYKGQMERMSGTLTGRLSNLADTRKFALANATKSMTADFSATLGEFLRNGDAVEQMGGKFDKMLAPVGKIVRASARIAIGGGITEGVSEGISATSDVVEKTLTDFVFNSLIWKAMQLLQINSPSKVFIKIGQSIGEGLNLGIRASMQDGALSEIERFRDAIERIKAEFEQITGRKLPGVVGQTATHTKLGFDHSQGADIAVAPGTPDAALVERLAAAYGVPVLRQWGAKKNKRGRTTSTGAHLHLGRLSPNLDRSDAYLVSEATATPEMMGRERRAKPGSIASNATGATPVYLTNADELAGMLGRETAEHAERLIEYTKVPKYEDGKLVGYDAHDPTEFRETGVEGFGNSLPESTANWKEINQTITDLMPKAIPMGHQIAEGFRAAEIAARDWAKEVIGGKDQWQEVIREIDGAFQSSFRGMFQAAGEGWRGMLGSFVTSFTSALQEMAAAALAQQASGMIGKIFGMVTGALFGGFSGGNAIADNIKNYGTPYFAEGGVARGPGTGTSDSIIARISNGEGILTADATEFWGGERFINALNNKQWPSKARFATGGYLDASGISRPSRADYARSGAAAREAMPARTTPTEFHLTQHFPITRQAADLAPRAVRAQGAAAAAGVRRVIRKGGSE